MISLINSGQYRMIETKADTKVLELNGSTFAWVNAKGIGEILVTTHKQHKTDAILSVGSFKLYEVKDEPGIADLTHLELEAGNDVWQSYLLLTGLPNDTKKRSRIIPSQEYITGNKKYSLKSNGKSASPGYLKKAGSSTKKGGE
jgi:hypothetical protein